MRQATRISIVIAIAVGAAACSSMPEETARDLGRARAIGDVAEQADAQQFAAADLSRAREKLREAEMAAAEDELEIANRLAAEAELDAELAAARARTGKAEASAAELEKGVDALRDEASRDAVQPQRR